MREDEMEMPTTTNRTLSHATVTSDVTKNISESNSKTPECPSNASKSPNIRTFVYNNIKTVRVADSSVAYSKDGTNEDEGLAIHSLTSLTYLQSAVRQPTISLGPRVERGWTRRTTNRRGILIKMKEIVITCLKFIHKLVNSPRVGIFYGVLSTLYGVLSTLYGVLSIFYGVLSTLLLAFAHFAAQLSIISSTNLPEEEVVFVRSLGQVVMLAPFLLLFQSRILYGTEKWVHLTLLSLSGYLCYITLYYVLQLIPLSAALSISATCPFFASLLSVCILKEKFALVDILFGVVSFLGVMLIARPSFIFGKYGRKEKVFHENVSEDQYQLVYLIGCAVALVFALSRALYLVLGRKWSKDSQGQRLDTIVTVFYPSVLGCVLTPMLMVFTGDTFKVPSELYGACSLFSVGILAALGLMCLMLSLQTQTPTVVGVIRNLEIIWAFLLQYLVLGIPPSWWSISGGFVVVAATIAASFRESISKVFIRNQTITLLEDK